MPNNNRLLKSQRPTVDAIAKAKGGKIVRVRDRSCNYRDAFVEWQQSVILDNGKREAVIFYETRLEVTPSGKVRQEQTQQIRVIYCDRPVLSGALQLTLPFPQAQTLPPPPPTIERQHLYPKDKSKPKKRPKKNFQQQTLPLSGAVAKLQTFANRRGELPQSSEALLEGKGIYYSLDGKKIPVPEAILKLLVEYECSAVESEALVNLAGVLNSKDLLQVIEQIPLMRKISDGFPDFQERVGVTQPSVDKQPVLVSVGDRL
jgi:hypothetical protein